MRSKRLGRCLEDGLRPDGSGVVDQNVEAAEFGGRALDQVANGVLIADIGGDGEGAAPQGADGLRRFMDAAGQAFGGLFALGGHGHIRAFPRQTDSQIPADAAAGSRDHRHAAAQVGMKNGVGFAHTLHHTQPPEIVAHSRRTGVGLLLTSVS